MLCSMEVSFARNDPFSHLRSPQKSVCELDLSADSAKSIVHARVNSSILARSIPKLRSFEYHTRACLGFEISAFISVL